MPPASEDPAYSNACPAPGVLTLQQGQLCASAVFIRAAFGLCHSRRHPHLAPAHLATAGRRRPRAARAAAMGTSTAASEVVTLSNGVEMPAVGFGTYQMSVRDP